jgi:hypothetical protein
MTQTLIAVFTPKPLSVMHNVLTSCVSQEVAIAHHFPPLRTLVHSNEIAVHGGEKTSDDSQRRVLGVGPRLAATGVAVAAILLAATRATRKETRGL